MSDKITVALGRFDWDEVLDHLWAGHDVVLRQRIKAQVDAEVRKREIDTAVTGKEREDGQRDG